jgi:hypothetical protein
MFTGHYSASFAGKAVERSIPLWVLFVAVQFLDFCWAVLVLAGVEKVRVVPGFMAASALDLYYMPYTHSLAGAVVLSAVFALVFRAIWKSSWKAALIVGAAVFSHWVLDLLVHAPDLLIYGNVKAGFGLWNYFWPELALELVLIVGTMLWYQRGVASKRVWVLLPVFLVFQAIDKFGPPPGSVPQAALSALAAYIVLAAVAAWVDWAK